MLSLVPAPGLDPERQQRVLSAIAAAAVTSPAALEALQRWHQLQAAAPPPPAAAAPAEPLPQQPAAADEAAAAAAPPPARGARPARGSAGRAPAASAGTPSGFESGDEDAGCGGRGGGEDEDEEDDDDPDEELADGDASSNSDGGAGPRRRGRRGSASAAHHAGAGRRLTYEDLQAQFGLGLKDAAANLGICATTLKRACRRNGITRWPRRQIAKLNRALAQAGYQGLAPQGLVPRPSTCSSMRSSSSSSSSRRCCSRPAL
ncbi:MAG: RWP-RK domain-containing protein [Monoraphidium minutum]|nr:MAG: RWP-RK domain-containing protein [Monoraphidium minutum]